ncbi:metallophosphoesterase [Luteimonas deserti]|uniref:Metallophosphoesterase family protein n=1 Tax=Luteimonas deserti TaxID=2752306 RepID=A0A7Z0QUR2_9GAMM|nr:metallophosphoesterase [Luteimonas deserti]NYZ64321.1 metallophosphoesterase family protein [Luteimonas deserti]
MDTVRLAGALLHASWLMVPLVAWLLWRLRKPRLRGLAAAALCLALVLVWARFIEPRIIRVQETVLSGTGIDARIALVSDLHLGVYKDARFLSRLVDRLDALEVDAIAIAGDFTFAPGHASLDAMFAPLARLDSPVYAVLGNHDQQAPGPDIDAALRAALARHGVRIIEGQIMDAGGYRWAGLGDRWAQRDDASFLRAAPAGTPTLVLAHNPDSATDLTPADARLVLAGHTHGGQIRIPVLYRYVIPSAHGFDRGEASVVGRDGRPVRVFTTAGVGETGLPLRLFNPPTIDLLELRP